MREPVYEITILPEEFVRHFSGTIFPANLTKISVFLKGRVHDFKTKTLTLSAEDRHSNAITSRITLRFIHSSQAVVPPFFPNLAYYVLATSGIQADGPVRTITAMNTTDSPLIYHLSNSTVVTVENTTGTLYLTSQRVPPGTYYTMLYAGLMNRPDVRNYTAIVVYVMESGGLCHRRQSCLHIGVT